MINLNQIQEDCLGLLMSAPQLATVNIVLEKKFIVESQIEMDAVWLTVRNGKSGDGLLIEVPDIESGGNNVSGPPQVVILNFVSFQNGDGAFTDVGGGLFAEEIEQYVLDALHLQSFGKLGTIQADGKLSTPARDYPGINARRLTLKIKPLASRQTPRTATLQIDITDPQNVTLACATPGAKICYTIDGSFPSDPDVAIAPLSDPPAPLNPQSKIYTAPFAAQSGQVIRAAAYADGFNPGEILNQTIS